MEKRVINPEEIDQLKRELHLVRKETLLATRTGDFRRVAKLTVRASELNREINAAEGLVLLQDM